METESTGSSAAETRHGALMYSGRIHGALTLVLILLAAFLFAETIKSLKEYRYVGGGVAPSNAISVSGEGEVFAVPDTAEFTFSMIEEGVTVGAVQEAATTKANAAIDALKEQGIEEKDVKTVAYELHPKYEWVPATCVRYPCNRKQVQKGFTLNQSVRIKVHDLSRAGEFLELVTEKGVSSVSGLTFTIQDEDMVREEARKLAIDEARAKAEKLAKDLGVSLVRIVGFDEQGRYPTQMFMRSEAVFKADMDVNEAQAAPAVPAGENRIVSNVTIVYEIR